MNNDFLEQRGQKRCKHRLCRVATKIAGKRKENQACLGYLDREQFIQIDAKHNNEQ